MHWADDWPRWRIRLLGAAELAGAAGLVLPRVTRIATFLTPVASACLAVLMAGAIATHRRLGEGFLPAAIVAALCAGIAVGHFSGPIVRGLAAILFGVFALAASVSLPNPLCTSRARVSRGARRT